MTRGPCRCVFFSFSHCTLVEFACAQISCCVQNVEKAILKSDLGFTPNVDGNLIRINVPQLTQVHMPA